MVTDFESLAVTAEQERIKRERAYEEQLEEWRSEDETRERDWKAAMVGARRLAHLKYRHEIFGEALEASTPGT